jgi:hypothetical protein
MSGAQNADYVRHINALIDRVNADECLLVCYRMGRRPTEKLFDQLERTKSAVRDAADFLRAQIDGSVS